MANLISGQIDGTDDYINIETLFDLNLIEDTTYSIQIQGKAIICESINKPEKNSGFYWNSLKPFGYKKQSAYFWVKANKGTSIFINISE